MKPIEINDHHRHFQRKDRKSLRIEAKKKRDDFAFRNLPFVAGKREKVAARAWTIPASGGYFGGYDVGKAMALLYLKFDRAHGGINMHAHLTAIVESFFIRIDELGGMAAYNSYRAGEEENDGIQAIRGQFIGFMNTISDRLTLASKFMFQDVETITEEQIFELANVGLNFDFVAYMGSLKD